MSNQTAVAKAPVNESPVAIPVNSPKEVIQERARGRIESRAYELHQEGGHNHNDHISDWLRAEAEIFQRVPEIRESASWYTINIPVSGISPSHVQISIDQHSALIVVEKGDSSGAAAPAELSGVHQTIFNCAKWPAEVDPATGSAYIKNEVLTLSVKQAFPTAEPDRKHASDQSTVL